MPGLTKIQAIQLVQQGLGFRSDKSAEIEVMMELVQSEELERGTSLPWFLIVQWQPLVVSPSDANYFMLPSNFIRFYDENRGVFWYSDEGEVVYLKRTTDDWIAETSQGVGSSEVTSEPAWYATYQVGSDLAVHVWPNPGSGTFFANYYFHATPVSLLNDGQQNEWLVNASGLLVALTGLRMAEDLEHQSAMTKFQARVQNAQARLLSESAMQEISDREFVMGSLV